MFIMADHISRICKDIRVAPLIHHYLWTRINAWFFHVARFEAGLSISISSIKAPLSSIAVPHYVYLTLQGCWRQFNKKVIVGPTCEISLHILEPQ